MTSPTSEHVDLLVRRRVEVTRYERGLVRDALRSLSEADRSTRDYVSRRFRDVLDGDLPVSEFLAELLRIRGDGASAAVAVIREGVDGFRQVERGIELTLLALLIPVPRDPGDAAVRRLYSGRTAVDRLPRQWLSGLSTHDRNLHERAVRRALAEGLTTDQLLTELSRVGTRSATSVAAVAETLVTHASSSVAESVHEANGATALVWTAVLDGRTTAVCRSRDQKVAPLGDNPPPDGFELLQPPGARPPAHARCRSFMLPVYGDDDAVRRIDYEGWLRRQNPDFQLGVLGPSRYALFRSGQLTLDEFVDLSGRELSLRELAQLYPGAFRLSGLNPNDF